MNDIQLSESFWLHEFTDSVTADKYGIDNTPTARQIDNMTVLCLAVLQPIRDALGQVDISSGFRCGRLNKRVGGSESSHHRCFSGYAAADFRVVGMSNEDVIKWVRESHLPFEQLIIEPSWIHIASYRPRRQVMRAEKIDGEMVYTLI